MVSHSTLLNSRLLPVFRVALLALLIAPPSMDTIAGEAEKKIHRGVHFWVYRYEPEKEILSLHLTEKAGDPNLFPALAEELRAEGKKLLFATNSGIFEGNFQPTGLHISEGKTITKLNLETFVKEREGQFTPNFFLKPNAVFSIDKAGKASILESTRFAAAKIDAEIATQSGPLLVAGGKIHPILTPDSTSTRYRNGVGVRKDGSVIFACSVLEPDIGMSNLYRFAEFFRDQLECPDVLYLDGDISYIFIDGKTDPIEKTNFFAGIFAITPRPQEKP
jgi:uncharacterized protein YigE (DUF2233 family)